MLLAIKILLNVAALLFALPAHGQIYLGANPSQGADCKGVVHGVVIRQDGKPWSGINLILEPFGDFDYVLPRTKTDQHGQYRFLEVPCGRWRVFVEDEEAGYPHSGHLMNSFLYGGSTGPEAKVTDEDLDAQLNINVPPRPGILVVHLTNTKTKAKIPSIEVELKVTRKRRLQDSCEGTEASACGDHSFLVPPNQDVRLRIKSKGFHEWKGSTQRSKLIHLSAGEVITIDAELDPI
jgi:hypothetical protein